MDFSIKIRRKKVLYLFLPLFVEKSYFTLAMILDFAISPLPPWGEVVGLYQPIYIAVLTFWRPSWTPSWILEKAPAGITGSFSMLFLMVFGRFPEKFSLGIFFSPLKPNTIRLLGGVAREARVSSWSGVPNRWTQAHIWQGVVGRQVHPARRMHYIGPQFTTISITYILYTDGPIYHTI